MSFVKQKKIGLIPIFSITLQLKNRDKDLSSCWLLGWVWLDLVQFCLVWSDVRYGSLVLYLRPRILLALVLEAREALQCKMEGQKEGWTEQALHYIKCLVPISSLETWRCGIKWELASCLDSLFVVGQIYELRFNAGRGLGELKQTTHSPVIILGQNIYIKS